MGLPRPRATVAVTGYGQDSESIFTTPKSTFEVDVKDSPGAGVDEHTCQFLSMTCIRPCPVRSVEVLKNAGLPVSACIASWAVCRFPPRRSGITHDFADADANGASLEDVSCTVTVAGAGPVALPHPVSVMALTAARIPTGPTVALTDLFMSVLSTST